MQNEPLSNDIDLLENSEFDDKSTSYLVHYKNSIFQSPKTWLKNMSLSVWKGAYFKRSFKIYKPFYWPYLFLNSLCLSFVDIKQYKNKDLFYLMNFINDHMCYISNYGSSCILIWRNYEYIIPMQ